MNRLAAMTAALLVLSVTPALADAIDGDWCRADGKHMSIKGRDMITPGGRQVQGDYTRHSFAYVIPAGEDGAGEAVTIILRSEYLAHARQGGENAPWQEWRRCLPTTS